MKDAHDSRSNRRGDFTLPQTELRRARDWMTRSRHRFLDAASPLGERLEDEELRASYRPTLGREFLVIEPTQLGWCVALAQRAGHDGVRLRSVREACGDELALARAVEHSCSDSAPGTRAALVVTSAAQLRVLPSDSSSADPRGQSVDGGRAVNVARGRVTAWPSAGLRVRPRRTLVATISRADRRAWEERLDRAGLELAGLYPVGGCAVAALPTSPFRKAELCLQLEPQFIAVIEISDGGCRALELVHGRPTLERCVELVGTACPEVLFSGSAPEMPTLACDLARTGVTWVRLLRPAEALGFDGFTPESLASIAGAARHACGLAALDAVACIPPSRVETE